MPYKDKRTYNNYHKKYQLEFFIRKKKQAVEYLGGKCIRCGYDKYYGALHFHHRDPTTKVATWDTFRKWSEERRKHELDKCDLLCANCHAETHDEWYKNGEPGGNRTHALTD